MIEQLAKEMNINPADVKAFAQSMANSRTADGVQPEQIDGDMVQAYAKHAVRKTSQFATIYHTNPEARKSFQRSVLALL